MSIDALEAAQAIQPQTVADRRHIHENPELGFEERETASYIVDRLKEIGITDIQTGVARTGVVALIHGEKGDGKCVLLRADIDALPILEESDKEYVSKRPGVMHACGHDAHTAMLLAAAQLLMDRRAEFVGTVKLCFQPSEEANEGGACVMIDEGVLENPHVDAVFGQHVGSLERSGVVKISGGPIQASTDEFSITVQGKGGHGAVPHSTIDTIMIAAEIVGALHTIVSRNVDPLDPAVLTVGTLHAGTASNIIPDTATMTGTVRMFRDENRDLAEKRITEVAQGIAATHGGSAQVVYHRGYPSTVNDHEMAELVEASAKKLVDNDQIAPQIPMMPAEDFSYFLNERPGAYWNLGVGNEDLGIVWGHHHPKFDVDEEAFPIGVAMLTQVAIDFLNRQEAQA